MISKINLKTSQKNELIDITNQIKDIVKESKIKEGTGIVFTPHATGAIICNENADPNIEKDFWKAMEKAIPTRNTYLHDAIDSNAGAHIRASILGPDMNFIIQKGEILLGTWQAIMFAELDGPRKRSIYIKMIEG